MPRYGRHNDTGITPRAVLIGLVLVVLLILAGFYLELVTNLVYNYNTIVPPVSPLGALFLLAAVNPMIARRLWGLTRRELLTVYVLMTVGAPLMAHGTVMWFLSSTVGWQYYSRVSPHWGPAFLGLVPTWFSPTEAIAAEGFFQGDSAVPWSLWSTALTAWGSFFIALFLANLFLMLLLQRQWITNERLSFPIAQIPLETVADRGPGVGRLPAAKMFWIGFVVSALLCLQDNLPTIFPSLPRIPLWGLRLMEWHRVGPLAGVGDIWLVLIPWIIALGYLVPKELSFSGWFFYLVRILLSVAAIAAGAAPRRPEEFRDASFPAPEYQGGGAVIALGLLALWAGRHYLVPALRSALTRRTAAEDGQPITHRWIVVGLVLSLAYLVFSCCWAGSRLMIALALIGLIVFYHMVWARLRAENGMSFIAFPLSVSDMLLRPVGTAAFLPPEIMTITATRWAYWPGWGETCEVITGASLDGLKIADSARMNRRRLAVVMAVGFVFALVVSVSVALAGCYHYGFHDLYQRGGWLESEVQGGGARIYDALTNPTRFSPPAVIALGCGMVATFLLSALRLKFWWWPLHPVGYLVANVWGSQWWWGPLFIAWVLKTLVVRYGGLRLYQKTVPLAIGVIVGNQLTDLVWPLGLWLART
jgi:hypothetical protein